MPYLRNSLSKDRRLNKTLFVRKIAKYVMHLTREHREFVCVINDSFLIATDEILPLGVNLHLTFDREVENRKRTINLYAKNIGKVFERPITGNVCRATYSLPGCNKFIPILINPNYKIICLKARTGLKSKYPGVIFNLRS